MFPVVSQTIAATPPLLSFKNGLSQGKDRPWKEGIAEKTLKPIALYGRAARNSIANRAIVGQELGDDQGVVGMCCRHTGPDLTIKTEGEG